MKTTNKPYKVIRFISDDEAIITDSFESAIDSYKKMESLNAIHGDRYCECYQFVKPNYKIKE